VGAVGRQDLPSVPVSIRLADAEWFAVGEVSPTTVELGITGAARNLFRVALDRPTVVIPIAMVAAADTFVVLRPEWVQMSGGQGVAIEGFNPSTVRLRFERRRVAPIPVSLRFTGSLPDSLALLERPQVTPLFSQVSGPASVVEGLETIFTEPFDLGLVQSSGKFDVTLDTTGLGAAQVSPPQATLTVRVVRRASRDLGIYPVASFGLISGYSVEPPEAAVAVFGAGDLLAGLDRSTVGLRLDPAFRMEELGLGEEIRVALVVTGLSEPLLGEAVPDSVTVRRPGS